MLVGFGFNLGYIDSDTSNFAIYTEKYVILLIANAIARRSNGSVL